MILQYYNFELILEFCTSKGLFFFSFKVKLHVSPSQTLDQPQCFDNRLTCIPLLLYVHVCLRALLLHHCHHRSLSVMSLEGLAACYLTV